MYIFIGELVIQPMSNDDMKHQIVNVPNETEACGTIDFLEIGFCSKNHCK
jgi:hypothetical protein